MRLLVILALVALIPCVTLPYLAIGANPWKAISDPEWLQLYAEQYAGPLLALLCGSLALVLIYKKKRPPITLFVIALLGGFYGWKVAQEYSHDWGHEVFDTCGTQYGATLLPCYLVAGIGFLAAIVAEVLRRRKGETIDTEQWR